MGISIAVLGAGSWGTTLAILLAEKGHKVFLWAHRKEFADELNRLHENKRYLSGITIPESVQISSDIHHAAQAEMVGGGNTSASGARDTHAVELAPFQQHGFC
jgi:glycerol-3-phosphate dehydrogenase (NAD(P)+)